VLWYFASTNENGDFSFGGVPLGIVKIEVWTVPAGYTFDRDKREINTGITKTVELRSVFALIKN